MVFAVKLKYKPSRGRENTARMKEILTYLHQQITGSSRSCACGHVFEDPSRFIGGKRFSGIVTEKRVSQKAYSKVD